MLKHITLVMSILCSLPFSSFGQILLTYEKLETYSIQDLENMATNAGIPPSLIGIETSVDFYKVTYLTPYLHPDSLVQASGAIVLPTNPFCSYPLMGYGHGTQSKRSKVASNRDGGQWEIGALFASTGYVVSLPDYLGMGDADPRVPIHPYTHAYSQANTMINMLRSARELCATEDVELNDQVFLFGYSQGGGATVAAVKEIEENYSNEFQIAGSAPMSGAYDLIDAQVDLILSENVYPTPGYLPYVVLAYQSVYGNLYSDVSEFLKSPYDSIIPELFFEGNTGINSINNQCPPVPKDIVVDSTLDAFINDPNHPLKLNLQENDLITGWYPTTPMKLIYCQGDDQVSYLNSENAYNTWSNAGAPFLSKADLGSSDHQGCASFAILLARSYFDSIAVNCALDVPDLEAEGYQLTPNPATESFTIRCPETKHFKNAALELFDGSGRLTRRVVGLVGNMVHFRREDIPSGLYYYQISDGADILSKGKVILE